jgi:hypothetical protein
MCKRQNKELKLKEVSKKIRKKWQKGLKLKKKAERVTVERRGRKG